MTATATNAAARAVAVCPWCGQPFEVKSIGAHRKRFCSPACKGRYHTALRRWAQKALAEGELSLEDLRSA